MGRFLSGLFGSAAKQAPAFAMRVSSALEGVPIAWLLGGQQRVPVSLMWYGAFDWKNASSSAGGKGGVGGGSSKGQSGSYTYSASFIAGICEGPVAAFGNVYINGAPTPLTMAGIGTSLGSYSASIWGYLESFEPSQALAYRGVACILAENYPLGSSPAMPNLTIEVMAETSYAAIPGVPDSDPSVCWNNFLTNPYCGVGFPSNRMAALNANASSWSNYCIANGLLVSPLLTSQVAASSVLDDLLTATNSTACWEDGQLTVVPYGDTAVNSGAVTTITETHVIPAPTNPASDGSGYCYITIGFAQQFVADQGVTNSALTVFANAGSPPPEGEYWMQTAGTYIFNYLDQGATVLITYEYAATTSYVPPTQNVYDFTLDDFLPNQGTIGTGITPADSPLIVVRTSRDQLNNDVKVEYLDRANNYNPVNVEIRDEASIVEFGRTRSSDVKQMHMFCLGSAAQLSATLLLARQKIARTFQFTLPAYFWMILELMRVYTVSDPGQGLSLQPIRLTEIQENSDFTLTVTAEEFLGNASAPLYGVQSNNGFVIDFNVDPGPINAPIIFEPTDELAGGLQIWGAVSGQNQQTWGGCYVYVSYDNATYSLIGTIQGGARMGVTTTALLTVPVNPIGQTIDQTHTLQVDLTMSGGTLTSGSLDDALDLTTRCYVGGEIISFKTATLSAANKYGLNYLVRGAYGTESEIVNHTIGTPFARLDQGIFEYPFQVGKIGSTLYLKFCSFNAYGGGVESLADVSPYNYTITGSALASPLPNVTNLSTAYVDGFANLNWTEISDFRTVEYEIRLGASWASGLKLGTVAHPPFATRGDGTFWVAAVSQPAAGLTVYSETPTSLAIAGNLLTSNILESFDEQATGWSGSFDDDCAISGALIQSGSSGSYTIPASHIPVVGRVAPCAITVSWAAEGVPVGSNILALDDLLSTDDILGSAATQYVNAYPRLQIGQPVGDDDLFAVGDLYTCADVYFPQAFGPWQPYAPGTYNGSSFNFQMQLATVTPQVICAVSAFRFTVNAPARQDHVSSFALPSTGAAFVFSPDGSSIAAPFNGGPNGSAVPYVSVTILNAQAGDLLVVTNLSLTGVTLQIKNAGVGVARAINADFEGY